MGCTRTRPDHSIRQDTYLLMHLLHPDWMKAKIDFSGGFVASGASELD
jgi:hypothetical protein